MPLRSAIAGHLADTRGIVADASRSIIIIVGGIQEGITTPLQEPFALEDGNSPTSKPTQPWLSLPTSLTIVSWKDRKAILPAIKAIYRAENAEMARVRLEGFEAEWGQRYPRLAKPGAGPRSMSCHSSRSRRASAK
jgi:hypothetical protein